MRKPLFFCGILYPLVFAGTVIYGGAITPGYSHAAQAISELVQAGAEHRWQIDPWFSLANLLGLCFAVGVFLELREKGRRLLKAGASVLLFVSLSNFLFVWFPMDPVGAPFTLAGRVHWVLAGFSSLGTLLTMVFIGLGLKGVPSLGTMRVYTLASCAALFVAGLMTWAGTLMDEIHIFGILERLTLGTYMLWVFMLGLRLYSTAVPAGQLTSTRSRPAA